MTETSAKCDGAVTVQRNWFDEKTDPGSSEMYFHYYGMLQHQQNMLQDTTRTGTYFWAIMRNQADFAGKVVLDVGAGSGILSLFASQVWQPFIPLMVHFQE